MDANFGTKLKAIEKELNAIHIKLDLILDAVLEKKKIDNIRPATDSEELDLLASNPGLVGRC